MDATGGLQPITSHPIVRDRHSGKNRGDREAFQRALQEHGEKPAETEEDSDAPVPPRLQRQPGAVRREPQAHHVDVIA